MFTIFIAFVALFLIITVYISLEAAEMLLVYLPAVVIIALIAWYLVYDSNVTKNIKYVIIKERIQNYKIKKVDKGYSFGLHGGYRFYVEKQRVPDSIDIVFEVTYNDGKVRTVVAEEGSERCNELLKYVDKEEQMRAEENETENANEETYYNSKPEPPVDLQKNQLTPGDYLIGKEIPEGIYDLTLIWGKGSVKITNGKEIKTFSVYMGNQYEYQQTRALAMSCARGDHLIIEGNIVVEISRSKKPTIEL